jgi:hypothetical protein
MGKWKQAQVSLRIIRLSRQAIDFVFARYLNPQG